MIEKRDIPSTEFGIANISARRIPKRHKRDRIGYIRRNYDLYFLLIPALVYILILTIFLWRVLQLLLRITISLLETTPLTQFKTNRVGLSTFPNCSAARISPELATRWLSAFIVAVHFPLPITAIMLNEILSVPLNARFRQSFTFHTSCRGLWLAVYSYRCWGRQV